MDSISDYDYELPAELIASEPEPDRDGARLLRVGADGERLRDYHVRDLPELLAPGDLVILNNTKVLPAKLSGVRTQTGGRWSGLFVRTEGSRWEILGQTRGRLQPGESITLHPPTESGTQNGYQLTLVERSDSGGWWVVPEDSRSHLEVLDEWGAMPLPPYIPREEVRQEDRTRYQTVYAQQPGAIAAPTAGLHFTPNLLERLQNRGIGIATVTLHVGIGTFRPVSAEKLDDHQMHEEWCCLPESTARAIRETAENGGRIVAVGTTCVRTLEAAAIHHEIENPDRLRAWTGTTDLFIRPPYRFRIVDVLLTNFHLPKSTLLVLVSTFAGHKRIREAYRHAVSTNYRFFSYGDAMLLFRATEPIRKKSI